MLKGNASSGKKMKDISGIIMMPAVMREIWRDPSIVEDNEACLETCTAYSSKLEQFAYSDAEKDREFYENFRNFLSKHSLIFQKDYALIEFLTDEQINYALAQVREARKARLDEKIEQKVKAKQPQKQAFSHKT